MGMTLFWSLKNPAEGFALANLNSILAFLGFNTIILLRYNVLQLRKIESNDILYKLKPFSTSLVLNIKKPHQDKQLMVIICITLSCCHFGLLEYMVTNCVVVSFNLRTLKRPKLQHLKEFQLFVCKPAFIVTKSYDATCPVITVLVNHMMVTCIHRCLLQAGWLPVFLPHYT